MGRWRTLPDSDRAPSATASIRFAGDVQRLGLDCPRRRTVAIASQ